MNLNKYLKSLYGRRFTAHLILGFVLSFITAATQYANDTVLRCNDRCSKKPS